MATGDEDIDGGPTEILEEAPWTRSTSLHDDGSEPALALVSLNSRTASTVEFRSSCFTGGSSSSSSSSGGLRSMEVTCGRGATNTIVLEDPRVSLRHFTIRISVPEETSPPGALVPNLRLLDESSNGTWLNDQLVGKDRALPLAAGDRVFVLPSTRVGVEAIIGYAVVLANAPVKPPVPADAKQRLDAAGKELSSRLQLKLKSEAELAQTGAAAAPTPPADLPTPARNKVRKEHADQLMKSMQCRLCEEAPIHRCVTAAPCGHNFDLGCLIAWCHKCKFCPSCGEALRQVVRNHGVDRMAETFVAGRPEAARVASTTALLDNVEKDPRSAALLARLLTGAAPTGPSRSWKSHHEEAVSAEDLGLPQHLAHLAPFVNVGSNESAGQSLSARVSSAACTIA